jgi:hypothetical protein
MDEQARRQRLRHSVRYFYDMQKLRIQCGNRAGPQGADAIAELDEYAKEFMDHQSIGLKSLEKEALKEVKRLLKGLPIYETWLKNQKGCGPTLSGVIATEVAMLLPRTPEDVEALEEDPEWALESKTDQEMLFRKALPATRTRRIFVRDNVLVEDVCPTISALWSYSGLAVDPATGKAKRRKRGVQCNWNTFLQTKLVGVLGPCLLKANSPWREHYDNKKHQRESANWGTSKLHRHNDAVRYMIKMFLAGLWNHWRDLEGLPKPAPYAEAKLGVVHGGHGMKPSLTSGKAA